MSEIRTCGRCGAEISAETADGLCPRCLMAMNFESRTMPEGEEAPKVAPLTPEEMREHFPQFEILECLGRGGMGVVYKARQKALDRVVAIKVLAGEWQGDPGFAARFEREAKTLAQMSHTNIVTVHDFGEADGLYYIVMEFVDGVNLRDLLLEGKMEPEQALAIVPPVCEALEYAHGKGVVHRDIKPENLLLDRDGRIKIADFGIAAIVAAVCDVCDRRNSEGDEESQRRSQTAATVRAGTPAYMAPEQERGSVDRRADIYALGVVLYEMLTGERPEKDLVAPSRKVQVDVKIDEMVLRALEKEPERRYQTAGEFRTMVETIASGSAGVPPAEPGVAPGPPPASHFSRLAIWGAVWPLALPLGLVLNTFAAMHNAGLPRGSAMRWVWGTPGVLLILLGELGLIGMPLLGWIAVSQIRHAKGKLYGLGLAVFDGLLFPVLALDALLIGVPIWAWRTLYDPSNGFATAKTWFLLTVVLSVVAAAWLTIYIIRRVWRAVNKPVNGQPPAESAPRRRLGAGFAAWTTIVATLLIVVIHPLLDMAAVVVFGSVLIAVGILWFWNWRYRKAMQMGLAAAAMIALTVVVTLNRHELAATYRSALNRNFYATPFFDLKRFNDLQPGMSEDQIRDTLGYPLEYRIKAAPDGKPTNDEIWWYYTALPSRNAPSYTSAELVTDANTGKLLRKQALKYTVSPEDRNPPRFPVTVKAGEISVSRNQQKDTLIMRPSSDEIFVIIEGLGVSSADDLSDEKLRAREAIVTASWRDVPRDKIRFIHMVAPRDGITWPKLNALLEKLHADSPIYSDYGMPIEVFENRGGLTGSPVYDVMVYCKGTLYHYPVIYGGDKVRPYYQKDQNWLMHRLVSVASGTIREPGSKVPSVRTQVEESLAATRAKLDAKTPAAMDEVLVVLEAQGEAAAVDAFLKTDWSARPLFRPGSLLSLSEDQFAALPDAERSEKSAELNLRVGDLRTVTSAVRKAGLDAAAKGDFARARQCFDSLKRCGRALDVPGGLLIIRAVGQAVEQKAGEELAKLSAKSPEVFGPVIESLIASRANGGLGAHLDLETGRHLTPPEELSTEWYDWARSTGVDGGVWLSSVDDHVVDGAFQTVDVLAVSAPESDWDRLTPSEVKDRVEREIKARNLGLPSVSKLKERDGSHSRIVWLFKTRDATYGMLQVTGFSDQPRGVRIRYKLVHSPEADHPSNLTGNFVLYVSNQSLVLPMVDMTVYIDGRKAVEADFHVAGTRGIPQHRRTTYTFKLPPGKHVLRVESSKGKARAEQKLEITEKQWMAVDFWLEGKPGGEGRFTFHIQDEPIRIE